VQDRGHAVPTRLVEMTRNLLLDSERAAYWAFKIAYYTWEHRSPHVVNAFLRATAHALRAHAFKKYGGEAHLHPIGFKLLRFADRIETVELLLNNRALAERLVWHASLSVYERAREIQVARTVEAYAMTVAAQGRVLSDALLRQQREAGLMLLDKSLRVEELARALGTKSVAVGRARLNYQLALETYKFHLRELKEARRSGNEARVKELEPIVKKWETTLGQAREALSSVSAELRRSQEELLRVTRELEDTIRKSAPDVYDYISTVLNEAFQLAARAGEMGTEAYMQAVQKITSDLASLASNPQAPGWVREAAARELERWKQLRANWKMIYELEANFASLAARAERGEILAPPKLEIPPTRAPPAGFEELRRVVEGIGEQLRDAIALHDYERAAKLLEEYVRALERVERAAQGTELAEWARLEREAWLRAREELLIPPEVAHALAEAERLAGELRNALEARDYASFCDKVAGYASLLQQLREHPRTASWASGELEKLLKLEESLLERYYELVERLGGEPLPALASPDRFAFELAVSLAPASPEAAEQLLPRIQDGELRDWARGYLEAVKAYAAAREEASAAWALERVQGAFSALRSEEERAGFLAYAVERNGPLVDFSKFGASASIVEEAFNEEVRRLALEPKPQDWGKMMDKFIETLEPELIGKAMAHAALVGELGKLMEDGRVRAFAEKCRGDAARFEEWWRERERAAEEVAQHASAVGEELQRVREEVMALRAWLPEPGESLALRMLTEVELERARERVRELWDRADDARARVDALYKQAEKYMLDARGLDALRDEAKRLIDELSRMDAELR